MPPPLTRGPLPAGVYWRRRLFVCALAGSLVLIIASLLGAGSDAEDDDVPAARQASGEIDASQTITVGHRKLGHKGKQDRGVQQGPTFDPGVLVDPDGNCEPADVRVTPRIEGAIAGRPVTIGLSLQTVQADACYFRIGPDKVTVKVTRGGREIWTSRECPDQVPEQSVVVRRMVATLVQMTWDSRESDSSCSHRRSWLLPADFTVAAAALGGEPADSDFTLATPPSKTIIKPPRRHHRGDRGDRGDKADEPRR